MRINTSWLLRMTVPILLPMATIGFMVRDALRDDGPTGLPGDLRNWHNKPGELKVFVVMVLVEAAVSYRIIRPWTGGAIWWRALATAGVFFGWLLLNALLLMHAGGVMLIHFVWLIAIVTVCFSLFVTTGLRALLRHRAHRSAPTV